MFKRIYTVLVSSVLLTFQSLYAAPSSASNIKKIIKKDGKVIVIVRENGKDKEIVLDQSMLNKITSKKDSKKLTQKSSKSKKTKVSKKSDKKSKKSIANSSSSKVKKSNRKNSKKIVVSKPKKSEDKILYKVKSGDTIFSIARKYKVSILALTKINKLTSSKLIHPGDILKIPSVGYLESAKEAVANNKKSIYIVKAGDTLTTIAKKFNMKIEDLKELNNFKPNPKLKPGMEVNVIGKERVVKVDKKATKYRIKKGDTLWSISKRFGLSVKELRVLNPSIRTKGLRRGLVLKVSKSEAKKMVKLYNKRKSRLSGLLSKYRRSGGGVGSQNVVSYAKRFLGVRYVWGATGRGGFDCSGFTQYVMRHAKGRVIPRVSRRQAYYGRYVSRRNLRPGDLIFFDTSRSRRGYVNHVAIYIGNGYFIHASSAKHRVVITSLNKPFYRSRFMWGRRIN